MMESLMSKISKFIIQINKKAQTNILSYRTTFNTNKYKFQFTGDIQWSVTVWSTTIVIEYKPDKSVKQL